MKTKELKPSYYVVKFYSNSRRLLFIEDYLYVETFHRFSSDFEALQFSVREAARCVSVALGRSVYGLIDRKVADSVALSNSGHFFPCPDVLLRKFKVSLIRE